MVDTTDLTVTAAVAAAPPDFVSVGRRWTSVARQWPALPLAILVPFVLVALFGVGFLGERLGPLNWAGIALIALGAWFVTLRS